MFKDIEYGEAYNNKTNEYQKLKLDAYFPPESDQRDVRPAVVFMHGGGFSSGDKMSGSKFAQELARRGYVAFSVNYRLTGDFWSTESQQAVHDA